MSSDASPSCSDQTQTSTPSPDATRARREEPRSESSGSSLPLHVSLDPEAIQLMQPPLSFDDLRTVTTRQEQAVSAINRDVVELVGRQKVALNDVLEENQRLQIRYNNLVGTYDTWSKQVVLDAERELTRKMSLVKDELATKYDAALEERTRQFTTESLKLRAENEAQHRQLLQAKEELVQMGLRLLDEQRRAQRVAFRLVFGAFGIVISLLCLLVCMYLIYSGLGDSHHQLTANFDALQRRATENQNYLTGNGLRSGLVKLLKPNLPHGNLV